jgi:hypothetical protein
MNYDDLYLDSDLENGLPLGLTASIAKQETGHIRDDNVRNRVSSPAGAIGRMQFMPATGKRYGMNSYADLTDPVKSINASGRYLGDLYRQFGQPDLTAAAYNAGEHRQSLREGRIPAIPETQKYVKNVMRNLASMNYLHGMVEKHSPSLAQRSMDFFVPPAYGADQPQGPGVMTKQMYDASGLDSIANEPDDDVLYDASGLDSIANEPDEQSGMDPTLQSNIRSTVKGLSAPITMGADAINAVPNLISKGINAVRPGTTGYIQPSSELVDAGLRGIGVDPMASGTAERAVTAALGAAAGGGVWRLAGLVPDVGGSIARIAGQVMNPAISAATASLGADAAQAAGVGPVGQMVAGAAAGMVPGLSGSAVNTVVGGVDRMAQPFYQGGKERIAGRLLNKQASAPQTTLNRVADPNINREIIPGSAPTIAEVSQDPGLSRLQRVLPSVKPGMEAGIDQINAVRVSQIDEAIHKTLDRVNKNQGGRDVVEKVREIKRRIGSEFEQGLSARGIDTLTLPVDPQNLSTRARALLQRYEGNDALTGLVGKVLGHLDDGQPSFNKLWNMRQSLDDAIFEKWAVSGAGSKADLKRVGDDIRSAMNADLVAAVPEFKPFLDRYARMSRAEGRLKLGRQLKEGVQNMGSNLPGEGALYGERTLSLDKLQKIDFDKAQKRAGAKLAPYQREAFDAAMEEKRRANFLLSGGAGPRSDTAQNQALEQIISDDILSGLFGDTGGQSGLTGILRNLGRNTFGAPVTALTKGAQSDIMRMIAKGLIDPQEGARLMRLGQIQGSESFANKLRGAGQTGVLSSIYSQMVR